VTKRTIFYTTSNNGDGSSSVGFYESQACIDRLENVDPEGYGQGEGGGSFTIDGTTDLCVDTMADVEEYLVDMGLLDEEEEGTDLED
jgi:hypothetical protein